MFLFLFFFFRNICSTLLLLGHLNMNRTYSKVHTPCMCRWGVKSERGGGVGMIYTESCVIENIVVELNCFWMIWRRHWMGKGEERYEEEKFNLVNSILSIFSSFCVFLDDDNSKTFPHPAIKRLYHDLIEYNISPQKGHHSLVTS